MDELEIFNKLKIGIASDEKIREWSKGEVKKPETINYRTLKPEKDGLFCERIFGPTKDWECHCGKYKRVRYKGIVCDRCGVEVTKSKVRRERMGHIELAAPVAHIWYFKGIPSRIGLMLDVSPRSLEKVIYFASYIVIDKGTTDLTVAQVLSEKEYREAEEKYGAGSFTARMGAEAIQELLAKVDVEKLAEKLKKELEKASEQKKAKLVKRLDTVEAFRLSGNKPEWMIMNVIPVIPPDLRPMVQLDGGRFATSDLNDLYRRVINRNNRLKRLLELGAPEIIVRNEKRMLQEAVDALIDNSRRGRPVTGAGGRALKSLSDLLKGKQGRFRQNLLGKRVDYSGRSVIVVGPELKIYQCGVPKEMAVELFKPFVMKELVGRGIAHNIKNAKRMVERLRPEVWDILEDVIKDHPVLLNRAPTLHRLSIQAFEPVLVGGKALRLHPLVCSGFNADFDGDQMAIHIPISEEAQAEARLLMLGANNILDPKDGKPIVTPSQDMVLGNYYLTLELPGEPNEGKAYKDPNEALMAYERREITLHTRICIPTKEFKHKVWTDSQKDKYLVTTAGKILFNEIFPDTYPYVEEGSKENIEVMTPDKFFIEKGKNLPEEVAKMPCVPALIKKDLGKIIAQIFKRYKTTETSIFLDKLKDIGFKYSTKSGITISLSDIPVNHEKETIIEETNATIEKINKQFKRGLITDEERHNKVIKLWTDATTNVQGKLGDILKQDVENPLSMIINSGARGSANQLGQLAGMRGIMAKPDGGQVEIPILASFREGLDVQEFFLSTHGSRKGTADTALKTADAGYLTRRLVDVVQDIIVKEEDCGTIQGIEVEAFTDEKSGAVIESFKDRITGRFSNQKVLNPETKEVLVDKGALITEKIADKIEKAGITKMEIRSVLTCKCTNGVCQKCYGINLATGNLVEVGEATGIMAAQSIGEPGTQLTMRTFHTGGVASAADITQGLPRVEELFEARIPKAKATIAEISGKITKITDDKNNRFKIYITNDVETREHVTQYNAKLRVEKGDVVNAGDPLTEGSISPKELLAVTDPTTVQGYILKEIQKVYKSQGVDVSDKHVETVVRRMITKIKVVDPGDTNLIEGLTVPLREFAEINKPVILSGGVPATGKPIMLGITKASLETDSFLSAASFQETTRILTDAATRGKMDMLHGLKENVILGKLIPAGTGAKQYNNIEVILKNELLDDDAAEVLEEKFLTDDKTEEVVDAMAEPEKENDEEENA